MTNKAKTKFFIIIAAVAFVAILTNYIFSEVVTVHGNLIKRVTVNGILVKAELVQSEDKIEKGLAGRVELPDRRGMLFQMPEDDEQHFWMKGMLIPIDIIWIENGRVTGCEKNIQPSDPRVFNSPSYAGYVLEVPAGFCDANQIKVNDEFKMY
ncbi:MAG: DUF192 domain-containing protein [Candidatus Moranbacteria bacterium]|nr:DUF192 domain-containing protein [Candidatus Moranbacteria bacterium]